MTRAARRALMERVAWSAKMGLIHPWPCPRASSWRNFWREHRGELRVVADAKPRAVKRGQKWGGK